MKCVSEEKKSFKQKLKIYHKISLIFNNNNKQLDITKLVFMCCFCENKLAVKSAYTIKIRFLSLNILKTTW